ncbi:hypothetical protein Ae201684_012931 [Aphanomyces euteiches]|uniref:CSC1/OSCA1-like 7TM region domain-containing protein n=1 Tax=Aphanomyces euteiches TaxID=100861 RepID=A0A6G0WPX4_9STRA|nr:hypothetical protein Ae201684_012931 [Aphanomyces euteiches]
MPTPPPITSFAPPAHGGASSVVLTGVRIYLPLLVGCLLLFELLRKAFPNVYNCKMNSVPTAFARWIPYVWRVSDDEIMEASGLDSLIFLRFLRVGKHLAAFAIILSIGLFPAYSSKKLLTEEDFLDRLSISGLPRNDNRLWATIFAAIAMAFFTMFCIARECQAYKERRHQFLAQQGTQQYSVLVDEIPLHLRSHTALKRYFNTLFPSQVQFCYIAVECGDLERLVSMRQNVRNNLEHARVVLAKTSRRPTHLEWHGGCSFERVDSIATYERALDELNDNVALSIREIEAQQKHGSFYFNSTHLPDTSDLPPQVSNETTPPNTVNESTPLLKDTPSYSIPDLTASNVTFVTFSTLQAANTVQQIVHSPQPHEMKIYEAPPSEDIVWENVGTFHYEQKQLWILIVIAATSTLILFWTVPTTLVVVLSSVDSLRRVIPHLNDLLTQFPWLESFLQQLSPLGLVVMNSLAPVLLRLFSYGEGHVALNAIEAATFAKVVAFQLVQTFFVASVAGSLSAIADKIQMIIEQPLQIIPMLGSSVPGQSTLFVSFILVQTGLSLMLQLLRVVPIFLGGIYWLFAPKLTQRERSAPWLGLTPATTSPKLDVTTPLAQHFLVFLLVLTFAPLAPIVSVVGGFFFLIADIVYRRLVLCVVQPARQSTGMLWPQLYAYMIVSLVLSQCTLIGVLLLKQAPSLPLVDPQTLSKRVGVFTC